MRTGLSQRSAASIINPNWVSCFSPLPTLPGLIRYLDKACAQALSKYRINPGNVGKGEKHDTQFGLMIEAALRWDKPVRIGVNWGSLDQELLAGLMDENSRRSAPWAVKQVTYEALVTSALESAHRAVAMGMKPNQIILSCKVSGVQDLISVY